MEKKILIASIIICICSLYVLPVMLYISYTNRENKELPISYPEEISMVKIGDTLYVEEVSDSIYIGF